MRDHIKCQQFRGTTELQQKWQDLPPVEKPLERVSLDLMDMVAEALGYHYVLTITDHCSCFVKFFLLKNESTEPVCEAFAQYMSDSGVPRTELVDNGGEFTTQAFHSLCKTHIVTFAYTTPYPPQGNSVTEHMHHTLKSIQAYLCNGHPLR